MNFPDAVSKSNDLSKDSKRFSLVLIARLKDISESISDGSFKVEDLDNLMQFTEDKSFPMNDIEITRFLDEIADKLSAKGIDAGDNIADLRARLIDMSLGKSTNKMVM